MCRGRPRGGGGNGGARRGRGGRLRRPGFPLVDAAASARAEPKAPARPRTQGEDCSWGVERVCAGGVRLRLRLSLSLPLAPRERERLRGTIFDFGGSCLSASGDSLRLPASPRSSPPSVVFTERCASRTARPKRLPAMPPAFGGLWALEPFFLGALSLLRLRSLRRGEVSERSGGSEPPAPLLLASPFEVMALT